MLYLANVWRIDSPRAVYSLIDRPIIEGRLRSFSDSLAPHGSNQARNPRTRRGGRGGGGQVRWEPPKSRGVGEGAFLNHETIAGEGGLIAGGGGAGIDRRFFEPRSKGGRKEGGWEENRHGGGRWGEAMVADYITITAFFPCFVLSPFDGLGLSEIGLGWVRPSGRCADWVWTLKWE